MGRSDGVGVGRTIVCLISPAFVSTEGSLAGQLACLYKGQKEMIYLSRQLDRYPAINRRNYSPPLPPFCASTPYSPTHRIPNQAR